MRSAEIFQKTDSFEKEISFSGVLLACDIG